MTRLLEPFVKQVVPRRSCSRRALPPRRRIRKESSPTHSGIPSSTREKDSEDVFVSSSLVLLPSGLTSWSSFASASVATFSKVMDRLRLLQPPLLPAPTTAPSVTSDHRFPALRSSLSMSLRTICQATSPTPAVRFASEDTTSSRDTTRTPSKRQRPSTKTAGCIPVTLVPSSPTVSKSSTERKTFSSLRKENTSLLRRSKISWSRPHLLLRFLSTVTVFKRISSLLSYLTPRLSRSGLLPMISPALSKKSAGMKHWPRISSRKSTTSARREDKDSSSSRNSMSTMSPSPSRMTCHPPSRLSDPRHASTTPSRLPTCMPRSLRTPLPHPLLNANQVIPINIMWCQ
eukprot:08026_1